jgi:short-subunit dehydrogenase
MIEQKEGGIVSIVSDEGCASELAEGVYSGCKVAFFGVSKAMWANME